MENVLPFICSIAALFLFWGVELLVQCRQSAAGYVCKLLGIITLAWFFVFLKDIFSVSLDVYPVLSRYLFVWDLVTIPLTSIYVFEIVRPGWGNRQRYLRIMVPCFLSVALYSIFFFTGMPGIDLFYDILCVGYGMFIIYMVYFVNVNKKKYRIQIENNFSFDERINIRWIDVVQYLFFWDCLSYFLTLFYDVTWMNAIYYTSVGITWWILYHFTVNQDVLLLQSTSMMTEADIVSESEAESGEREDAIHAALSEVGTKLERLMTEEQAYLDPNLTLADLAVSIGSNKTYVYLYLKNFKKESFSDYINNLRIKEKAIPLLEEHLSDSEMTIAEIAYLSGFQSLSTFRRAFHKAQGCTASSYIGRMKDSIKKP